MSGDLITLEPGDVVPDCPIPLRPDGSCEAVGHVLDPVHLDLVLGVNVCPEQEQAIMDACREITTDDAASRRLWVWSICPATIGPLLHLHLHLRPGGMQWRHMHWNLRYPTWDLCEHHAGEMAEDAHIMAGRLSPVQSTKGLHARILVVGRDHRLLGISHVACHGELSYVWLVHLFAGCMRRLDPEHPGPPAARMGFLHHIAGLPHTMRPDESAAWMRDHGWIETPEQQRLRRRRRAANRRAGR